jgi:hypothetical protein
MSVHRKLWSSSLPLVLVVSHAACASEPEPQSDSPGDVIVVRASDETREALGVSRWEMSSGAGGNEGITVTGKDEGGATRVESVIRITARSQHTGAFDITLRDSETTTLHYEIERDHVKASDVDEGRREHVRDVVERMRGDLSREGSGGTALTTRVRPLQADANLVTPAEEPVVSNKGQCLLDNQGNGCAGQLITAGAGVLATAGCVLTSPATLGAQLGICVPIGAATIGAAVTMKETGCEMRPCK